MTVAAPPRARTNPWILGATPDLLLIVLTPLLVAPIFWGAQQELSALDIAVYVAAFGAFGHQLPGLLRAYGDPRLFARFKTRFLVAPIFLVAVCMIAAQYNLIVMSVIVLLWGFWHAVMQVYGFVRIYDTKVQSTDVATERLDLLTLFSWFTLGLLGSGGHMASVFAKIHVMGGPLIDAEMLEASRRVLFAFACLVTAAFLVNLVRRAREGHSPSPVKLVLMLSSAGMYWYAMVYTSSTMIGIALFEVFHDIQYLTIVWAFNHRLAIGESDTSAFTRMLFRRAGFLVGIYILLVAAYGMIGLVVPKLIASGSLHKSLNGILIAAALLHFYFDGFIWKVREKSTRAGLELAGGRLEATGTGSGLSSSLAHGLKWVLFLAPIIYFGIAQRLEPPTLERHVAAADAHPFAVPHDTIGRRLLAAGREEQAVHHFEQALRLDPDFAKAHHDLGSYLMGRDPDAGLEHLRRVVALEPTLRQPRETLADALASQGRFEEAAQQYRRAIELGSNTAERKLKDALAASAREPAR